jgi:hypothetical protein
MCFTGSNEYYYINSKRYKVGDLVTIKPDIINRFHDQLNKFRNKIGKINAIWEDNKNYHNSFALISSCKRKP